MPEVSVLIPLYNCEAYLEKCIQSICDQTFPDLEIIISDDASTDNSFEIAKSFEARDSRIKVIRQEKNIGCLRNYNFLLRQATGNYFTFQDSDDWSASTRIEEQHILLEKNPEYILCGTFCHYHFPNKIFIEKMGETDVILNGPTLDILFSPPSLFARTNILKKLTGMNEYLDRGTSMDRYFITEMLSLGKGYYINRPLYHARVRPNSNHKTLSEKKITSLYLVEELINQRIREGTDWLKDMAFDKIHSFEKKILADNKILSEAYREAAVFDVEFGDYGRAWHRLKESLKFDINKLNMRTFFFLLRKKMFSWLF